MSRENRQLIVDFFDQSYLWWQDVYEHQLPRGFFSFEMIRRKEAVLHAVGNIMRRQPRLRILECGCGPGGLLGELPNKNHLVCGLDINQRSLQLLKTRSEGLSAVCGDIEHLPFVPASFDVVLCVGVLSYLQDDELAIKEMVRLLRPGGQLLLANPNFFMLDMVIDPYYLVAWPLKKLRHWLRGRRSSSAPFAPDMIRRYRYGQLDRLFREAGLIRTGNIGTSYGPLRFWRKECLPLARSMRFSDALVRLARRDWFGLLPRLANHWVTCLEKPA